MSQLLDLGKKWRAGLVGVYDGTNEDYTWRLKHRLRARLEAGYVVRMLGMSAMPLLFLNGGIESESLVI
ncbi:hypothetical protein [Microcoleus sp. FACHB-672]|uniref:hypothetical protein n=1 Tax=Microcoleus sp. FACHB-672 TaxID=2692825 RepID=UPI00168547E6|nr:hypothetical protein [Microcoleus sp. FACHB-672]MBD2039511.1 hypothetical protein [Microcoleus sp. FACHB-672]